MSKIGLFFGSFNPIHNGHMIIAQYMLNFAGFNKIRFVVSPHNPLKDTENLWPAELRLELVKACASKHTDFEVTDIEFHLPTPSYTIDTLRLLQQNEPQNQFEVIMGSDNLANLPRWKGHEGILNDFVIHVYKRSGNENPELKAHPNVRYYETPFLDISATMIRDYLMQQKSVRYLLPDAAFELLQKVKK